ncbi:MAG: hypothetical protein AAF556_08395, partial [Pseudomonadota bacterium]
LNISEVDGPSAAAIELVINAAEEIFSAKVQIDVPDGQLLAPFLGWPQPLSMSLDGSGDLRRWDGVFQLAGPGIARVESPIVLARQVSDLTLEISPVVSDIGLTDTRLKSLLGANPNAVLKVTLSDDALLIERLEVSTARLVMNGQGLIDRNNPLASKVAVTIAGDPSSDGYGFTPGIGWAALNADINLDGQRVQLALMGQRLTIDQVGQASFQASMAGPLDAAALGAQRISTAWSLDITDLDLPQSPALAQDDVAQGDVAQGDVAQGDVALGGALIIGPGFDTASITLDPVALFGGALQADAEMVGGVPTRVDISADGLDLDRVAALLPGDLPVSGSLGLSVALGLSDSGSGLLADVTITDAVYDHQLMADLLGANPILTVDWPGAITAFDLQNITDLTARFEGQAVTATVQPRALTGPRQRIDLSVTVDDMGIVQPSLTGDLTLEGDVTAGEGALAVRLAQPVGEAISALERKITDQTLMVRANPSAQTLEVAAFSALVDAVPLAMEVSDLHLIDTRVMLPAAAVSLGDVRADANGFIDLSGPLDMAVTVQADTLARLAGIAGIDRLDGRFDVAAAVSGTVGEPAITLTLQDNSIRANGVGITALSGQVAAAIMADGASITADMTAAGQGLGRSFDALSLGLRAEQQMTSAGRVVDLTRLEAELGDIPIRLTAPVRIALDGNRVNLPPTELQVANLPWVLSADYTPEAIAAGLSLADSDVNAVGEMLGLPSLVGSLAVDASLRANRRQVQASSALRVDGLSAVGQFGDVLAPYSLKADLTWDGSEILLSAQGQDANGALPLVANAELPVQRVATSGSVLAGIDMPDPLPISADLAGGF